MGRKERETEKKLWRQRDEARAELDTLKASLGNIYERAQQAVALEQQLVELQRQVLDAQAATRRAEAEAQRVSVTVDAWHAKAVGALDAAVAAEREEQRATVDKLTQRVVELEAALASETVEDIRALKKRLVRKAEEYAQLEKTIDGAKAEAARLKAQLDRVAAHPDLKELFTALLATDQPLPWQTVPKAAPRKGEKCSFKDCARDAALVMAVRPPGGSKPIFLVTCTECEERPALTTNRWLAPAKPGTSVAVAEPVSAP